VGPLRLRRALALQPAPGDASNSFNFLQLELLAQTQLVWADLISLCVRSSRHQSKFFETFAAPFTKRGLLLKFLLLGGGSLLAYVSASASPDLLPIKKGPQQPPQPGPRGKI
jgi:hypothetical protein